MLETAFWKEAAVRPDLFARELLGVELHDGQRRWLENGTTRENLLVTGNRWGKSFVAAIKLLHHALYRPRLRRFDCCGRYRAAVVSITQDQADIVFRTLSRLLGHSSLLTDLIEDLTVTPYPTLRFTNGAEIVARSTQNRGQYLLGNDYDLVIFDEVAFEPEAEYVVEEVLLMRLADREGKLDLVSTPNGKNWFYRRFLELSEGKRPGYVQGGDSRENRFISADYLKERMSYFSDTRQRQNIMGQFADSGGEILSGDYITRALRNPEIVRTPSRFLTGWDLARKRTATVGITVAVQGEQAHVIAVERCRHLDWQVIIEKIKARQRTYPGLLLIDSTGIGDVITQQVEEYRPESFLFTPQSKAELLTNLELLHAQDRIGYARWELPDEHGRIWSLEDELRQARWDDNRTCDGLMALALAVWPLRQSGGVEIAPRVSAV